MMMAGAALHPLLWQLTKVHSKPFDITRTEGDLSGNIFRRLLWAPTAYLALTLSSPTAAQAPFSEGTYVLQGGSYSIEVRREGDRLIVVEPNKRSEYAPRADGTYHFTNPTNGITYGLRIVDNQTIEAFKPLELGNLPTRLARLGGAPAPSAAPLNTPEPGGESGRHAALAQQYQRRAQSDSDNVQTWTACAAAAMKRSVASDDEADAYAAQMAQVLKLILVDPSRSPCEDAIPSSAWHTSPTGAGGGAEAAATAEARRLEQARRSEAENKRVEELNANVVDQHRQIEAANAQARAEFERLSAAHQRQVRAAEAAQQQHARDMAEHARRAAAHEQALARHRADVEACLGGDRARCTGSR